MQRNWLRYLHIAAKSWTAWNNVKHHTSYIIHLLSHHTSSIKHQTSSDCTGGRIGDAVRYCQSGQDTREIKAMRKFLSSTAWASFNQELPGQTVCVRKDCVELIYKVKPSVYVIVSMLPPVTSEAYIAYDDKPMIRLQ